MKIIYSIALLLLFQGCLTNDINNSYKCDILSLKEIIASLEIECDTNTIHGVIYNSSAGRSMLPAPEYYYLILSFKKNSIKNSVLCSKMSYKLDKNSVYYKDWLPNQVNCLFDNSLNCDIQECNVNINFKSANLIGFFCIMPNNYVYLFATVR